MSEIKQKKIIELLLQQQKVKEQVKALNVDLREISKQINHLLNQKEHGAI